MWVWVWVCAWYVFGVWICVCVYVYSHLSHFGFQCDLHYPRPSTRSDFFAKLVKQGENVGVRQLPDLPSASDIDERYVAVVDAIFGFSFSGAVRGRFVDILKVPKWSVCVCVCVTVCVFILCCCVCEFVSVCVSVCMTPVFECLVSGR
jgi:hypothetical protein